MTNFTISAPFPGIQTTIILVVPKFSDSHALAAEVKIERAQDGTPYSYVKSRAGEIKHTWQFIVNRANGLTVRAFFISYAASRLHIEDHNGDKWSGFLLNNPVEFTTPSRGRVPASPTNVRAEKMAFTLEFQGTQI